MSNVQKLESVVAVVREMRKLQKEYFRTRDKGVLVAAKKVEANLDKMLAVLLPEDGKHD